MSGPKKRVQCLRCGVEKGVSAFKGGLQPCGQCRNMTRAVNILRGTGVSLQAAQNSQTPISLPILGEGHSALSAEPIGSEPMQPILNVEAENRCRELTAERDGLRSRIQELEAQVQELSLPKVEELNLNSGAEIEALKTELAGVRGELEKQHARYEKLRGAYEKLKARK